jgi:hypothetical protein
MTTVSAREGTSYIRTSPLSSFIVSYVGASFVVSYTGASYAGHHQRRAWGTLVGSPMLASDGVARVRCGRNVGCVADRRMIGIDEVRLLSFKNCTLSSGTR